MPGAGGGWYRTPMRLAVFTVLLLSCASTGPSHQSGAPAAVTPAQGRPCAPAECERACEASGEPRTCTRIAELYWDGKGGHPFDPVKSFRFSSRACEAGDGHGCALLGLHHQDGIGTAWAPALAVAAYEKACRTRTGVGCFNLSGMYASGHGIDPDLAKADALMKLAESHWMAACKGAEPRWCTNAAYLLRQQRGPAASAESRELNQRACDHDVTVGCVGALADAFALGAIARESLLRELEALCRGGEPAACSEIGLRLDDERGAGWVKRACELGDRMACGLLGSWHEEGKHVPKDDAAKRRYFGIACDRGTAVACLSLAHDAITTLSPEAPAFAQRGCQMGLADACGLLAQLHFGLGDAAAGVRWDGEGCRMGLFASCKRLIERDAELPAIPADVKQGLYTEACRAQIQTACQRLAKPI